MVTTAMPLSFVSCTRSVISGLFRFARILRGLRRNASGSVNHHRGNALTMKSGVAKRCFRRFQLSEYGKGEYRFPR